MEPINPDGEEAGEVANIVGVHPGWAVSSDRYGRRRSFPIICVDLTRYPLGGEPYTDRVVVHIDEAASYALAAAMAALRDLPEPPSDQ